MPDIELLTEEVLRFRDARNWKRFHKPKDVVLSLMLEAAEVVEHFQWKDENEVACYAAEHAEEIGDELADVLYWVLLLAHDLGIDLGQAFKRKMAKNQAKYPIEKAKDRHAKYTEL